MKIIGLVGSIVGSKTKTAIETALHNILEKHSDIDVELVDLGKYNLVFCDGSDHRDYTGDTKTVIDKIMSADAIILGTPIFQASIPGALKNLMDLLPKDAFRNKAIGILVTAGSPKHYLVAEQQLKPILDYMQAIVVPKYVFIEEKHYYQNIIVEEEILMRIEQLSDDTVNWMQSLSRMDLEKQSVSTF